MTHSIDHASPAAARPAPSPEPSPDDGSPLGVSQEATGAHAPASTHEATSKGTSGASPVGFRMFSHFNAPELRRLAGITARIDRRALEYFPGDSLQERLVRALAHRNALPFKEVLESFEFFARTRRGVRAPHMADLCCGHGLTGLLFALFERQVERVVLLDQRRPQSYDRVLEAVAEVGPWVPDKVTYLEQRMFHVRHQLEPGTAVIAVHACGQRTDRSLETAIALGGNVAVMPCCYTRSSTGAPAVVIAHIGAGLACDIDRTYRLEAAGYQVSWSAIPEAITAMNRIIVGRPIARPPTPASSTTASSTTASSTTAPSTTASSTTASSTTASSRTASSTTASSTTAPSTTASSTRA